MFEIGEMFEKGFFGQKQLQTQSNKWIEYRSPIERPGDLVLNYETIQTKKNVIYDNNSIYNWEHLVMESGNYQIKIIQ